MLFHSYLSHLPAAAPDVVVPHVIHPLLVFALDGLSLAVDHRVRRHDTIRSGITLHHLKLYRVHGLIRNGEMG